MVGCAACGSFGLWLEHTKVRSAQTNNESPATESRLTFLSRRLVSSCAALKFWELFQADKGVCLWACLRDAFSGFKNKKECGLTREDARYWVSRKTAADPRETRTMRRNIKGAGKEHDFVRLSNASDRSLLAGFSNRISS